MADWANVPGLFLYPLLAGLFLGLLQIVVFFLGSASFGDTITDMLDGTTVGEMFDWLNLGKAPFSIISMLLLVSFGMAGMALMAIMPVMPAWAATFGAAPAAVAVTKLAGDGLARFMPKEETYAVASADLIGRTGVVTLGPLDDGPPGNVRVRDQHGELHTIRARPADAGTSIEKGAEVVVVSQDKGSVFKVMRFDAARRV